MKTPVAVPLLLAVVALAAAAAHAQPPLVPSSVPGICVREGFDAEVLAIGLNRPTHIALEGDGSIIVGSDATTIARISPTGSVIATDSSIIDPDGPGVDSLGRVFIAGNGHLTLANALKGGANSFVATGFSNLNAMAIDGSDHVFVQENDGRIRHVTAAGVVVEPPHARTPKSGCGLKLDPTTGGLLASDCVAEQLYAISPAGGLSLIATLPASSAPSGMDTGRGGLFGDDVYLSLFGSGEVVAIDRLTGEFAPFASGLQGPHDVALQGSGTMLVTEFGTGRLIKIFSVRPTANTPSVLPNR